MNYTYSILLLCMLIIYKSDNCQQSKYTNVEVTDYLKLNDLKDYNLIGNVKSVTNFRPLGTKSSKSKYRSPYFYAEFNKQGKLTYYARFSGSGSIDTTFHRRIYYSKNKIKSITSIDSVISIYDLNNNLISTEQHIYNRRYVSNKSTFQYDAKNRLLEAKQYTSLRDDKDFELRGLLVFKYVDDKKIKYRLTISREDTISTEEYTIDKIGRALSNGDRTWTYQKDKLVEYNDKYLNIGTIYNYKNNLLVSETRFLPGNETLKFEDIYDFNNNLIKRVESKNGTLIFQSVLNYDYDKNNNWIRKRIKESDNSDITTFREITYW